MGAIDRLGTGLGQISPRQAKNRAKYYGEDKVTRCGSPGHNCFIFYRLVKGCQGLPGETANIKLMNPFLVLADC